MGTELSAETSESPRPAQVRRVKLRRLVPYVVIAMFAVMLTAGFSVDMTLYALRNNYGMNVGQVRGGWFAVSVLAELLLAAMYWALLAFMGAEHHEWEAHNEPERDAETLPD
jgi:uncharacterized membrane protein